MDRNGLPSYFFQKHWTYAESSITRLIQEIFTNWHMASELNKTYITLIPKVSHPETIKNFRPISLCTFSIRWSLKLLLKD